MFRPNTVCLLRRPAGRSIFGKPVYSAARRTGCSIVKLETTIAESEVRADSSASRGSAEQSEAAAVILLPPNVKVGLNDVISVKGIDIRVMMVSQRFDIAGRLDHIQVEGIIKEIET